MILHAIPSTLQREKVDLSHVPYCRPLLYYGKEVEY